METRSILEDRMLTIRDLYEKLGQEIAAVEAINERHQDNEYRELQRDYERSIAC